MKKILVIINGPFTPQHVVDTAIDIAKSTSSLLHAFFLNYDFRVADYSYPFPNDLSLTRNRLTGKTLAEENAELLEKSIGLVRHECEIAKVDFIVDAETEISIAKLVEYSAYSDFILADNKADLNKYHLVDILVNAHCPVYLVSKDAKPTKSVILSYDGSASCMKAIKLFSYLFPELRKLPTYCVYINPGNSTEMPLEEKLDQWTSRHIEEIHKKVLHGDTRKELARFITSNPDSLVVMGAYGRTTFSRLFHHSLANSVIEQTKSSIFISHE